MPQGVLPLGQDLLPRQTMNNIVAALCQEGLLTEALPAVKAGKRPACSLRRRKKPPPGLLQIAPPVMLARLGVGFCFADAGRRPLT